MASRSRRAIACRSAARVFWIAALLVVTAPGCKTFSGRFGRPYRTVDEQQVGNEAAAADLEAKALRKLRQGKVDAAQSLLRRALEADLSYGPAHNLLGKIYYDQHRLYLAAWEFQYAAKLMPGRSEPLNNLGLTFEKAGRLDDAVEWYSRSLEMTPNNPDAIGNLARTKAKRGDRDEQYGALLDQLILHDRRTAWLAWAKSEQTKLQTQAVAGASN